VVCGPKFQGLGERRFVFGFVAETVYFYCRAARLRCHIDGDAARQEANAPICHLDNELTTSSVPLVIAEPRKNARTADIPVAVAL